MQSQLKTNAIKFWSHIFQGVIAIQIHIRIIQSK